MVGINFLYKRIIKFNLFGYTLQINIRNGNGHSKNT
jgi:hypothetical protein